MAWGASNRRGKVLDGSAGQSSNRSARAVVRRDKAAFFSGCKSHPATIAPAGSNRSSHGGNEVAEAFGIASHELVSLDFCCGSRLCENYFLAAETKY